MIETELALTLKESHTMSKSVTSWNHKGNNHNLIKKECI